MAIGRISGPMLKSNLLRQGTDLAVETNLLYVDVNNNRIGVNTDAPTKSLHIDNVTVEGSQIRSTVGSLDLGSPSDITISGGTANYVLTTDGAGNLSWEDVSSVSQNINGMNVTLSLPDDSSLYPTGAINDWQTSTKVTNALDDLNELAENIINNTAVANVDFTADNTIGGAGLDVTLTITADGNPNAYTIVWGDGDTTTETADSTPTHTYATNTGSPFDVSVTAINTNGDGKGSSVTKTREDYIVIFTANPVVSFSAYSASSGGSPITSWDDGDTVYFENTTTNTSGATVQYTWSWGDGTSDDVVSSDSSSGGVGGGRIAHTFTASTEEEQTRTVTLTLDSHSTANPSEIPTNTTNDFDIYDTHTPTLTIDDDSGINEESSSGHVVTFTNTTETTIGSFADYGITYRWNFGDGDTQTVNVDSGANGDTGLTISHTYALSSGQQSAGTATDFTGNLQVLSDHTSSPFASSSFTIHVEPDVRANIVGSAVTQSDGSADNSRTIYDFTDLSGNNRALVTSTNTSQNADDYEYDWGDGSTNDLVTEDGASAGSIALALTHDYAGESTGSYTLTFDANGTPDITAQTDQETVVFTLKATPSAPAGLSSKTLQLQDAYQGTSPRLASGFTDNSDSNPLTAGDSLETTSARRYTSGTIDTQAVDNAYNGASGTLTAVINGVDSGNKTFTTTAGETGTFTDLVITQQVDYHAINSSYPTDFYQVFDAKITQALTSYSVGVNDQRLEHSTTGNTNYVAVVYDDLTATPTFGSTGTLSESTGGTKRYISGIPYYNTGSPTLTLSGVTINDLVGQAYTNQTNIVEVDPGTNAEGTSSSAIDSENYSYANIDGASSMLTGGIPNVNTGTSSAYAIGNLTIDVTSSSVRTIETPQIRARNVNGVSSYSNLDKKIQVHTATQSGINELVIPVSDSLGATYDDDGIRIADFISETTDTPSFNGATNFYTNDPYSESSDPGVSGTQEATIRLGVLQHDTTDYSTGFLPVGPDRSSDTGTQYFTFAFRRSTMANFDIAITSSTGITGMWIAAPGTAIDSASGLNGWLETTSQYAGAGVPGSNTGSGGNGSDGCALTGADVVPTGSSLSSSYTMTLGTENGSNATGNVILVRIALASGESVSAISVGVAS